MSVPPLMRRDVVPPCVLAMAALGGSAITATAWAHQVGSTGVRALPLVAGAVLLGGLVSWLQLTTTSLAVTAPAAALVLLTEVGPLLVGVQPFDRRAAVVLVVGTAVLLAGLLRHLRGPFLAGTLAVAGLLLRPATHLGASALATTPRWLLFSLTAAILLAAGSTYSTWAPASRLLGRRVRDDFASWV